MATYQYPVTNKFQARAVTEPIFSPGAELFEEDLYVDLDAVRSTEFVGDICYALNIDPLSGQMETTTADYVQILVSGHRGCGKTTELTKLNRYLNHPDRYFSVFLSVEQETNNDSFQPDDFFVWFILKLVEAIDNSGIDAGKAALNELAKQLLSDKEIEKELKTSFDTDLTGEAGVETPGFFTWLKFKLAAKAVLSSTNNTSTKIREEVRRNTQVVVRQINNVLVEVRDAIQRKGLGKDLLFIVDGSEKLNSAVYEYLFVKNPSLLQNLAVNLLVAVPISSFYEIKNAPQANFPHAFIVPMIKLQSEQALHCFREVIRKRVDENTFFEPGVLNLCAEASGGCMRQLLIVVNAVISKARGNRATREQAEAAINEQGRRMYELLDSDHLNVLKSNERQLGDPKVRELLFQLVLLKYNGHLKINPLLKPFLSDAAA
jgi:energy-coupling factor transporter ATP-binding protein EcfA2